MLIQIVDDSRVMRETVRGVLAGIRAEFIASADGEEAVRSFEASRPDLVVMDIRLPGMDGLAATRAILRLAPRARVIMLTHYDDDAMRVAAHEAGAARYILKDDLSDLWDAVSSSPEEGNT